MTHTTIVKDFFQRKIKDSIIRSPLYRIQIKIVSVNMASVVGLSYNYDNYEKSREHWRLPVGGG